MALSKHPNVLRVRGEWIDGSKLCIAVRYMSHGKRTHSPASEMRVAYSSNGSQALSSTFRDTRFPTASQKT
jgi:hypothetical protein